MKRTIKMVCYQARLEAKRLKKLYPEECKNIPKEFNVMYMHSTRTCIYARMFRQYTLPEVREAKEKVRARVTNFIRAQEQELVLYSERGTFSSRHTCLESIGISIISVNFQGETKMGEILFRDTFNQCIAILTA